MECQFSCLTHSLTGVPLCPLENKLLALESSSQTLLLGPQAKDSKGPTDICGMKDVMTEGFVQGVRGSWSSLV